MPFTFAHPAVVLPLVKFSRYFSLSALVIGSMLPDFEYFIRMEVNSTYSHTLSGIILFDIPVGIIVWLMLHFLIKDDLIASMPAFIRHRLNSLSAEHFKLSADHIAKLRLSLFIGIVSHIAWDAFTHKNGYFVNMFGLNHRVPVADIALYKLLQHTSTLLGFIGIIYFMLELPVVNDDKKMDIKYWLIVAIISALILLVRMQFITLSVYAYGNMIVSGISANLLGIISVSVGRKCLLLYK